MEGNMSNFFDSIKEDNIPKNIEATDIASKNNNNFEVPFPPIDYKSRGGVPSFDQIKNDINLYEQYPNSPNAETVDYSMVISEQKTLIQLNILERRVKEDKHNQHPQILFQLIELYKQTNQKDKLDSLRDQTLKLSPLSENIWMDLIKDKRAQCITIKDQYQLVKVFKTAFSDFPYLNLSLMYIELLISLAKDSTNSALLNSSSSEAEFELITDEVIRNQFKELIKVWGLDIDLSSIVYDMYIDFEAKTNCAQSDMRNIWRERLSIPQTTIDSIWDEYSKWEKDNTAELRKSKSIYDSTTNTINYVITISERFKALLKDIQNENGLEAFISFLQSEMPTMIALNKNYVLLFFEKALELNYNQSELWKLYLSAVPVFNDRTINLNILRRASRCCPGEITFVVLFLREMEINGCPTAEIEQTINDSFSRSKLPSFQCEIWKCYLEFKCRNMSISSNALNDDRNSVRKLFNKAINSISGQSEYVDNIYHIWAEFECYKTKDAQMLIDIMNHIVIKDSTIHNWRAFIYYIKSVGTAQMIREVYKRSFDNCTEEREVLKLSWIGWEKVFGSPKTIDSTVAYTQNISVNQLAKELTTGSNNNNSLKPLTAKSESEDDRSNRKVFVKNLPSNCNETDLKQFILQYAPFAAIEEIRIIRDDNGNSRLFAFLDMSSHNDALALVNELNNKQIDDKHIITCAISKPPKEGENDLRTLFINNLSYLTSKEKLKEVFSVYGNILDIRLIINQHTNKPRGYGYIEYQNENSIELALNEHKPIVIDGRTIQLQKSQSVSKIGSKIKYVAHVTNFPYKVNESGLEKFLIENDAEITKENIIGVKIVKDNEGRSKGFGFVEFDCIQSLTKAINLRGKLIENRPIIIKESNSNIAHSKGKSQSRSENEQYLRHKTERNSNNNSNDDDDNKASKPKMKNQDFSKLFN